jgi:hypothetical protein
MSDEKEPEKRRTVSKTFSIGYNIRSKITWEKVKVWIISLLVALGLAGLVFLIIIIFLAVLQSFVSGIFPKEVGKPLTIEILKGIIQVDGILIGLNGIVYAQLLWSINSLQNTINQGFFENKIDKSSIKKSLKTLQGERRILILALLLVTVIYLASIFFALAHMAWTEVWQTETVTIYSFMYIPTLLLFSGTIISMVIASTRKLTVIDAEDEQSQE